jgi:MFS family permease
MDSRVTPARTGVTGPGAGRDRPRSSAGSRLADAGRLLRANPSYRPYLAARWTNTAGTTVAPLGLAFAVLARGGGATGLGIVLAGGPLVYLLVMPLAGVAGDRFSRSKIIACCHLVSGTGQSLSAALVLTGHAAVWSLALLAMTAGAAAAFLQPAVQGLVQVIVTDPAQLVTAGAVMQIPMNVVAVLGPALAGLAIAWFGPGGVLAWDAGTFFIAAALFASLRLPAYGDHRPGIG